MRYHTYATCEKIKDKQGLTTASCMQTDIFYSPYCYKGSGDTCNRRPSKKLELVKSINVGMYVSLRGFFYILKPKNLAQL